MKTITLAQARARVRNLIHSGSAAPFFEDDDLDSYIEDAMRSLAVDLHRASKGGWFEHTEDETLTANATELNLTTLLTYEFAAVIEVREVRTNTLVPIFHRDSPGVEDLFQPGVTSTEAPWFSLKRGQASGGVPVTVMRLGPPSSSARTIRIRYRWKPVLDSDDDILPVPKDWAQAAIYEAAIKALTEIGQGDTKYEAAFAGARARAVEEAADASGVHDSEGTADVVSSSMYGSG